MTAEIIQPVVQAPRASCSQSPPYLQSKKSVYYEHIRVEGLPRERGRQYGQKAREKIHKNIEHYLQPGQLPPWERVVKYIYDLYVPALEQHFPTAIDEMRGIAEGAGVTFEEIVMVNARYDLSRAKGGSRYRPPATTPSDHTPPASADGDVEYDDCDDYNECTSSAFLSPTTSTGDVITAQNWDMSSHLFYNDLVILLEIHPDPSENIPSMFLVTEAGQMGRSGMNSAGLGVTANSLNSSADFFPDSPAPYLPISMLRRLFLQSKSYPQGLQAISNAPRHVSNNVTLSTKDGYALCMEITPKEVFLNYPSVDDGYIIHANHFANSAFAARPDIRDTYPGGSSWYRFWRLEAGVRSACKNGKLDADLLTKAFSDHLGFPQSLCQHVDNSGGEGIPGYPFKKSMTLVCVVYNLTRSTVKVCKGPPCQGVFEELKLA